MNHWLAYQLSRDNGFEAKQLSMFTMMMMMMVGFYAAVSLWDLAFGPDRPLSWASLLGPMTELMIFFHWQ